LMDVIDLDKMVLTAIQQHVWQFIFQ
jgi:hypothetical protein